MSGFSRWIRSTMPPIGSSTSGIHSSSARLMVARMAYRERARQAICAAHGDQEDGEQAPEDVLGQRERNDAPSPTVATEATPSTSAASSGRSRTTPGARFRRRPWAGSRRATSPAPRPGRGRAARASARTGGRRRRRTSRPRSRRRSPAGRRARASYEQPDGDHDEERREEVRELARLHALLERAPTVAPTAAGRRRARACAGSTSPANANVIVPASAVMPIAASDVAVAACGGQCEQEDQQRHDDQPAADAEERAHEAREEPDRHELHGRIVGAWTPTSCSSGCARSPSARRSSSTSTACSRRSSTAPEDARVPDETREELRRLAAYALVACVSGRAGDDARRIVGLGRARLRRRARARARPGGARWRERVRAFADDVAWPVEDKGLSLSFHYRTAEDPEAAETYLLEVAERARDAGLVPRFGRMVLEVRPPLETNKGTAVRYLLAARGLRARALRRRRLDRPRRVPRARRDRVGRPRRGRLGRRPARDRRGRRRRRALAIAPELLGLLIVGGGGAVRT